MKTMKTMKRQSGQTLMIALIIMGVLLLLGSVFLGLLGRNIRMGGNMQDRSVATDLAEAGIRYAHARLVGSEQGADWRPPFTPATNRDPDFDFLKPGGPDGLGSYSRVTFESGRALIRVTYAPSDANIFLDNPAGPLRQPGKARAYTRIESVGKAGAVIPNDPTTTLERARAESRKLVAFAPIGIIEQAFFIHNKDHVSRPAELGVPNPLGISYDGSPVAVAMEIGTRMPIPRLNGPTVQNDVNFGGGIRVNGNLLVYGTLLAHLNSTLGDKILVSGTVLGADDATSRLQLDTSSWNRTTGNYTVTGPFTLTNGGINDDSMDSRSGEFTTGRGVLVDGIASSDSQGYARGVRPQDPPSMQVADKETGQLIYKQITQASGSYTPNGNNGQWAHGSGTYVNNSADRQMRSDEQGREEQGSNESLIYDWTNPNNGQANSGWQGPYYVPRGAYVQLLSDGFVIIRDGRAPANQRYWRMPDGTPSRAQDGTVINSTVNRFKIVRGSDGRLYIANSFTVNPATNNPIDINSATSAQVQQFGVPFNGVLFFEGNVRVRGVIPTNVQLTLVSNATIYVEGSITKGVVENYVSDPLGPDPSSRIPGPSTSMLMLMAKDYVAINTSQFFGPSPTQALEEVSDVPTGVDWNGLRLRSSDPPITLRHEMLLDPESGLGPSRPDTWEPYAYEYQIAGTNNALNAGLLLAHTMDDGVAPNSFVSLDINPGLDNAATGFTPDSPYLFPLNANNAATQYAPFDNPAYTPTNYGAVTQGHAAIEGLGVQSWQRYSKFESVFFPMMAANPAGGYAGFPFIPQLPETGTYRVLAQDTNDFQFRTNSINGAPTNDWLLARAAMVPGDVRIEASMFAEEGSFFVIPSPWFNPNPNDRRDTYATLGASDPERQLARLETFGANPEMPFFGEPLDVRVQIVGSVSENMTPPIGVQAEWIKKWGWIPRTLGATTTKIPTQHIPAGIRATDPALTTNLYVPNLIISYDPSLATGRVWDPGQPSPFSAGNRIIRVDAFNRPLPPMPRLPVSPTLAYFGEENQ